MRIPLINKFFCNRQVKILQKQRKYYEKLLDEKQQLLQQIIDNYEDYCSKQSKKIITLEKFIKTENPKLPLKFEKGFIIINCDKFELKYNGNPHQTEICINNQPFHYATRVEVIIDPLNKVYFDILMNIKGMSQEKSKEILEDDQG